MLNNQYCLPLEEEMVVDLFAGGGGASTGIEMAMKRYVDAAINHDPDALGMHEINHPQTKHFVEDIWKVHPLEVTKGRPVGILWASPTCTHYSKARGGKPVTKQLRSQGWVVTKWAKLTRPRTIFVENVIEYIDWGPLIKNEKGELMPDPKRKGQTFKKWIKSFTDIGYKVEWKVLKACDYGAPTIRKRVFIIMRCDEKPIIWPEPTHYDPDKPKTKKKGMKPYRSAASIIDWDFPTQSIFGRKKDLSENTLKRVALGIQRYVIDDPNPFIVQTNHAGKGFRGQKLSKPMPTISTKHGFGLVTPTIMTNNTGHPGAPADKPLATVTTATKRFTDSKGSSAKKPLPTILATDHNHIVAAHLAKHYTGAVGSKMKDPVSTITAQDHNALVTAHIARQFGKSVGSSAKKALGTVTQTDKSYLVNAFMMNQYSGGGQVSGMKDPLSSITSVNKANLVHAFLSKYYKNDKHGASVKKPMPTITTKDRIALTTVHVQGEPYIITDICMRMLQPHELYAAQGFPSNYEFRRTASGKKLGKTDQVRMCGNSVSPVVAKAIIKSNHQGA